MGHSSLVASKERAIRRSTSISLSFGLLEEARHLGVNISRACEEGLETRIAHARREQWLAENRAALESSNTYAGTSGLPLAGLRRF